MKVFPTQIHPRNKKNTLDIACTTCVCNYVYVTIYPVYFINTREVPGVNADVTYKIVLDFGGTGTSDQ